MCVVRRVCLCACMVVSQQVQLVQPRQLSEDMGRGPARYLLRQHVPNLLIAEDDVVHWFSPVLEGSVVVVDVRGEKDLGVPGEALAGGKVRDLEEVNGLACGGSSDQRGQ